MTLSERIADRLDYRRRAGASPRTRALELAVCAGDAVHWLSRWGWTYYPWAEPPDVKVQPFDPFPRQVELLRWFAEREARGEEGIVEKSRETGASWLCCAYAVHGWLFKDGYAAGFGSLKAHEVDCLGDLDSLLEKCRFLVANLPAWMRPAGYERDKHATLHKILNPRNGATITGATGEHMGVGGRKSVFFLDESARVPRSSRVDDALSFVTRCRIDVSTPQGVGGSFHRRRFAGAIPVFTLHWKDDPRKNQAWYENECRTKDPVTIAQNLDIDYSASMPDVCIPGAWVRAAVGLGLTPSAHCVAGLDVGAGGTGLTVLVVRRGPVVLPPFSSRLDTWQAVHAAADRAEELGVRRLNYDEVGVGVGARAALTQSGRRTRFAAVPVNGGRAPTEAVWPDGHTSAEKFRNLRAEMWWVVRSYFERTWQHVTYGAAHRPEEMISLPARGAEGLIAQLSLPKYFSTEAGKLQIESKRQMAARGVKSPDEADALVLSYAPAPPPARKAASGGQRPAWQTSGKSPDPGDRFAGAEGF